MDHCETVFSGAVIMYAIIYWTIMALQQGGKRREKIGKTFDMVVATLFSFHFHSATLHDNLISNANAHTPVYTILIHN